MFVFDYGDGSSFDGYGNEIERRFVPELSAMHRDVPNSRLIYNREKTVSQLQLRHPSTGEIELDKHSLVIYIDGACRGNGTPNAVAAWGVYFGLWTLIQVPTIAQLRHENMEVT